MDLDPGTDADAFRAELRDWLAAHLTDDVAAAARADDEEAFAVRRKWNATLVDAGWGAVEWPTAHGGRDATVLEQLAYHEEMARAGAPGPVNAIGVANIAPAIMQLGTPHQKERFVRPMLRGDEIWSQGMSEPEAGSDLASLRCRAELDGDHFVVNGQKTWNSLGHRADWCQLYVRTDPDAKKHQGISCLLVDMRTPGIEVRPIRTMADTSDFAEVFFEDVRVPRDALLGELHGGWTVATATLSHERAGVAKLYLMLRTNYERLLDAVATHRDDPVVRQELAACHTQTVLLRLLALRTISSAASGRPPGPEGSIAKLVWSQAEQRIALAASSVMGMEALGRAVGRAHGRDEVAHDRRRHHRGEQEHHRRAGPGAATGAETGLRSVRRGSATVALGHEPAGAGRRRGGISHGSTSRRRAHRVRTRGRRLR